MIYKAPDLLLPSSPLLVDGPNAVQLWLTDRQRHCWSPSQRQRDPVGGKSLSEQYKGRGTAAASTGVDSKVVSG